MDSAPPAGPPLNDPVEVALADALAKAAAAGEWGVVTSLARELEARRQAGASRQR